MPRLFVAVDFPEEVRRGLAASVVWMGEFKKSVKIVPAENFHLTLRFLGATAEDRVESVKGALEDEARGLPACELRLGRWGVFPEMGAPKVFWVGVEPRETLLGMAERSEVAAQKAGFAAETRKFGPHVTIARVGDSKAPEEFLRRWRAMGAGPEPVRFRAEEITLFESVLGGLAPVYRAIHRIHLGGA